MIKKLIWMVMLVLATACSVLFGEGGNMDWLDPITEPTQGTIITATVFPTQSPIITEISLPTEENQTPVATLAPTATILPTSTATAIIPTATNTVVFTPTPTKTPIPTNTPTAISFPYQIQPATPIFMQNFVHTDAACNWQGVAGQVFDKGGNPMLNYIVKVTGPYGGTTINLVGITGMVSGTPYGPASYEIVLGNKAIDTIDQLSIQLFDKNGVAITDPLKFSTSSACNKNLVIINFTEK